MLNICAVPIAAFADCAIAIQYSPSCLLILVLLPLQELRAQEPDKIASLKQSLSSKPGETQPAGRSGRPGRG
jgi:hypothetical protein